MKETSGDSDLFVKQELHALAKLLKEVLLRLKQHAQDPALLDNIDKGIELFLSFIRIDEYTALHAFFHAFANFFHAVQDGLSTDDRTVDCLISQVDKLIEIGNAPIDEFKNKLSKEESNLENGASFLYEKIEENTSQSHLKSSQEENLIQGRKDLKVDEAVLNLFLSELKNQVEAFQNSLESLKRNLNSQQSIQKIIQTARAVKQAGNLVQLAIIVELSRALENYGAALLEGKVKESQQGIDVCEQIVKMLKELSLIDPDHIPFFIQERQPRLAELASQLNAFLDASFIPKEEYLEQPVKTKAESREAAFDETMFDLFKTELENQCLSLNQGLIELEQKKRLEAIGRVDEGCTFYQGSGSSCQLKIYC